MTTELLLQLLVSGLGMGFIFALIAVGLALIYGMMGIVNFAHGEFLMISMYATYYAFSLGHLDPVLTLPLVAAAMFVLGVFVYYVLVRRVINGSMHAQIFATFGLMFFFGADYYAVTGSLLSGVVLLGSVTLPMPQISAAIGATLTTLALYVVMF